MSLESKGQSPFYPGQPVPVELFVGRKEEIDRISRAASQVVTGKPQAVFIQGDYGIGKTSLAKYIRRLFEKEYDLLGFHIMLGGSDSLEELAVSTVQTIIQSPVTKPTVSENIRTFLSRYIGDPSLFGITIRLENLKKEAPDIRDGFLPFLGQIYQKIESGYKGIILIFDEINGIANQAKFAHFIKSFVDGNAVTDSPIPILLILCGTEEKYRTIVEKHKPVERIFEIAQIDIMDFKEREIFFQNAFHKVDMTIDSHALDYLCLMSGGLPKLMHVIGDAAFWIASEKTVTMQCAFNAVFNACQEIGRKFLDQQVYKALQSKDYHSILKKISRSKFFLDIEFKKQEIEKDLNESEKKKFNNFIQRMKKLNVLFQGDQKGEYIFRDRLTRMYCFMKANENEKQFTVSK